MGTDHTADAPLPLSLGKPLSLMLLGFFSTQGHWLLSCPLVNPVGGSSFPKVDFENKAKPEIF